MNKKLKDSYKLKIQYSSCVAWEAAIRRITVRGWPWNTLRPSLKNNLKQSKRAGGIAQVVEYLPSKHQVTDLKP
jgi:hypothetical protein